MTFGTLLSNIMRIGAVTLLSEIAMKSIEQKDYANLIKFSGVCAIATNVAQYMAYLNTHPPLILTLTKGSVKGMVDVVKFLNGGKLIFDK